MLAIVSRNLVAAEGHYYRSCYRLYTKDSNTTVQDSGECTSIAIADTDAEYEAAEKQSYNDHFSYIREELFVNPDVVPLINLTARLVVLGVETVKTSPKKHIRRKLEAEFGEALQITQYDNGKLLVYLNSLSMPDLVKAYCVLQTKVQILESERSEDIIDKAAWDCSPTQIPKT
jgi:hypothetical protein